MTEIGTSSEKSEPSVTKFNVSAQNEENNANLAINVQNFSQNLNYLNVGISSFI